MTADTFPPAVVERARNAVADECHERNLDVGFMDETAIALAVLRALSPAAQAVEKGEAVAVPRADLIRVATRGFKCAPHQDAMAAAAWADRMLSASPYAEKEPGR